MKQRKPDRFDHRSEDLMPCSRRPDLALHSLFEQLQNALDSLKHRVEIDESVISDIRKEVGPAPWLRYKREREFSDLLSSEVADTTSRRLYNVLRKELETF